MAFSATGLPTGLSIDPNTGTISGTLDSSADASSPFTTVITVGDGAYSTSQTITWTVSPFPVTLTSPGNKTSIDNDTVTWPSAPATRPVAPCTTAPPVCLPA